MRIFAPRLTKGAIAQLVEQRTENPCVPGSIPGGTTIKQNPETDVSGFFVSLNQQLCIFDHYYTQSPFSKMYYKQIIVALTIGLLSLTFQHTSATNAPSDSIRKLLPILKGEELLQAHSNLCRLAAAGDDADEELACLRAYITEAHNQNNVEAEGQARSMQMMSFYNYDLSDSLKNALPANLEFMGKHRLWDHYYNSWNTLVEHLIYENKLQTALIEAQKMYADAKQNNSNYGLGVSAYCMGGIYQTMQRFTEAAKSLEESIVHLSKEEDISLLLSAYNALGETLDGLGDYERLRNLAKEWKGVLDKYKSKAEAKGYTPSLNGRYLYCTLAAAVAEIETNHPEQAEILIAEATRLAEGRKAIARFKLLQVLSRHYAATGQYDQAIDCNNENLSILAAVGDSVSIQTVELQQAEFMLNTGRYEESARLFQNIIPRKDKLRNTELAAQLDELSTIYEVDKLTLKNQIANNRLYFALVCCLMLLAIISLYIINTKSLRRKNRALYDAITQSQGFHNNRCTPNQPIADEAISSEEALFRKLCILMKEEKPFKDPQVKREDVAMQLGTNRTYLADAIKQCADGLTFTEYLNQCRLHQAATMLTENQEMPINEVGDESGFNSRSTFNRLFRDYYGMSPSEYRSISKEKRIRQTTEE